MFLFCWYIPGAVRAGFCVSSYYMEKTRRRVCVVSYYMEKFKPGGGWCSVFVEKTNKEKKTRKRVKFFIKSVDTDTETCYNIITDTETC